MDSDLKEKIVQEGGVITPGIITVTASDNPSLVGVVSGLTNIWLGSSTHKTLKQISSTADQYNNDIINNLNNGAFVDPNNNPIRDSTGAAIIDKALLLSDLMKLLDPTSQIYAVFNSIPLAQFKHLPDPSALNPVNMPPAVAQGGQLDLSSNIVSPHSNSTTPNFEEMPSLVIEDPSEGGSYRSNKWSSHKKRKSVRIRTKKNKKVN
jgi:hypothetical protein